MANFTPWTALAGGLLIGFATILLYFGIGKLGGISGILEQAMTPASGARWAAPFLLGLVAAGFLGAAVGGANPALPDDLAAWEWLLAGALVGAGARISGGCTSGHGVCGLARLNPRSAAATASFMLAGAAAVYVLRHAGGAL
jgi:uncharacterized protein